jgi:hypothetical protein
MAYLVIGAWALALAAVTAAMPAPPAPEDPPDRESAGLSAAPGLDAARLRSIATGMPRNASDLDIDRALQVLLPELQRATVQDASAVVDVLTELRQQAGIVPAFTRSYRQLPPEAFEQRLFTIGLVGELKRPDAMPFLHEVIWTRLPAKERAVELLSRRELEEMIQAKAVQGLAYLATAEADAAVKDVMLQHEATHVREAAIDAYMWNHGDSAEAATQLYGMLPKALHPFVERPRFHAGMDPKEFNERVKAWQQKWGSRGPPE